MESERERLDIPQEVMDTAHLISKLLAALDRSSAIGEMALIMALAASVIAGTPKEGQMRKKERFHKALDDLVAIFERHSEEVK